MVRAECCDRGSYLADGFCVSNKEDALWSSHAISFYADVATALGMMALVHLGSERGLSEAALTPIAKNSMSLLGHGVGHLFLGVRAAVSNGAIFEGLSTKGRLAMFAAFMPVWYGFMMDKRRSTPVTIGFTVFHNTLQTFFLPSRYFFTHVLKAVLLGSAIRWLLRPRADKSRYYALEAWLVDVPVLLASFGEALTCDTFLKRYGGHVWFDMVVPFGFLLYYMVLINDPRETTSGIFDADADKYARKPVPEGKRRIVAGMSVPQEPFGGLHPPAVARSMSHSFSERVVRVQRAMSDGAKQSTQLTATAGPGGVVRQLSWGLASPRAD